MNTPNFLLQQWQELTISPTAIPYFEELMTHYSAKNRHYHNLQHLQHIFETILPFKTELEHWRAVYWAIFYHDVIYNALRKDNEQKSAHYAQKVLEQLNIAPSLIALVVDLIIATQHHLPLQPTPDFYYFLDADLAILGSNPPVYQQYCQAVRQEYHLVPYFLYRKGRKKALKSILERERIYLTDALQQQLEKQARKNMEAELRGL